MRKAIHMVLVYIPTNEEDEIPDNVKVLVNVALEHLADEVDKALGGRGEVTEMDTTFSENRDMDRTLWQRALKAVHQMECMKRRYGELKAEVEARQRSPRLFPAEAFAMSIQGAVEEILDIPAAERYPTPLQAISAR